MPHRVSPHWLATCVLASTTGMAWAAGDTLVVCSEAPPSGFDPARYISATVNDAVEPLYNRLLRFDPAGIRLEPSLATHWEVGKDRLSIDFTLRRNVQFHTHEHFTPSRPLAAEDVVFTFQRLITNPDDFPFFRSSGLARTLRKVEALDTHRVRFHLHTPDTTLLSKLTLSANAILSAEYARHLRQQGREQDLDRLPVGTGPFQFQHQLPGQAIEYRAHPEYWETGLPLLSRLRLLIIPDATTRSQALRDDRCQVAMHPRREDLTPLRHDLSTDLRQRPGSNLAYIAYNTRRAPLDRPVVRQALALALDKPALVQAIYGSSGEVATGAMPPRQWSYAQDQIDPRPDPDQARALLRQAGIEPGTEFSLWAPLVERPYSPDSLAMAQQLKQAWEAIGLSIRIVTPSWDNYFTAIQRGEHDIALFGWSADLADPDNWLATLHTCDAIGHHNAAHWCDRPFDALIYNARQTEDRNLRADLYRQAQYRLARMSPITPLAHTTLSLPVSTRVKGLTSTPFGRLDFTRVTLD